jgi:dTDP-4-dehydrorhamnose reductase
MLGSDVVGRLQGQGEIVAPPSSELDIANPESMAQIAAGQLGAFDWAINCSGYTQVDKAESDPKRAYELNALGPGYLAKSLGQIGSELIHISTDFVFDGSATEPYTEQAETSPLGTYGATKLAGEQAVLEAMPTAIVLRTSWLYGPNGNSFPRTIIRAWEAEKPLRVLSDHVGCPTYTFDLADVISQAIARKIYPGIYHAAGPEQMSWFDFAVRAIDAWKAETGSSRSVEIEPIVTSDWPTPAKRPPYSVLSNAKLLGAGIGPMPPVSESLKHFCSRLKL